MEKLEWHTEKRKVNDLIPYEGNPRMMTEKQKNDLEESLKRFNLMSIPVINSDNIIVSGHQRLKILQLLERGKEEIDVRVPNRELTPEELREANLRENKNLGSWDYDLLANIDKEVLLDVGFTEEELDDKFNLAEGKGDEDNFDVDKALEEIKKPICKREDIWQLGEHRLMCGDATVEEDIKKLMDGKKADMVFTDPPYGVDYSEKNTFLNAIARGNRIQTPIINDNIKDYNIFFGGFLRHFKEILNDYNSFYITISGQKLLPLLEELKKLEYKTSQILVWCKNNHVLGRQDYSNKHELIIYGWVGKHKFYGGFQTTIWEIDKPLKSDLHPTMKPIELCAKAINNSSKIGKIVADFFGGSGSTLISCEQINRICYMMEIDPIYCDVIIKRWEKFTGKKAVEINAKSN